VGGGTRAGLEVVARDGAAERHVEVRVCVDAARHHEFSAGVDCRVPRPRRRGVRPENCGDLAVHDCDVCRIRVDRGYDRATLDQRTNHGSPSSAQTAWRRHPRRVAPGRKSVYGKARMRACVHASQPEIEADLTRALTENGYELTPKGEEAQLIVIDLG